MKRTKLVLGSLATIAIAGGLYLTNKDVSVGEKTYSKLNLSSGSEKSASWGGASEYYKSLYKNAITGEIESADYELALNEYVNRFSPKATTFTFAEEGPDNIGGRTRAIIVDVNDDAIVYAGSVAGGLFKSTDGGNNWNRLDGWDNTVTTVPSSNAIDRGSLSISSIAMTTDGTIYVGTGGSGELGEGGLSGEGSGMQDGDGIWMSSDAGSTFTQISGTEGDEITRLAADLNHSNRVYYTGLSLGLMKVESGTSSSVDLGGSAISTTDVGVSPDGQVILVSADSKVYVSQDGGSSFTNMYGSGAGKIPSGSSRKECAVSYDKNDNDQWTLYVAGESGGKIRGIYISEDNGSTWYEIGPASTDGWEPCVSRNGQCYYDMTIDAVPGHPDHCIFGGIDLYRWERTPGNDPSDGQWEQISQWSASQQSPQYIHADNHRITWNSEGSMYVGNDGGIQRSFDNTTSLFTVMNKGYNVTQFYGIGYGPDGEVIGGSQDNGTSYNNHTGFTGKEFKDVNGGDGFECEISFMNGEAMISSIYSAAISRSDDEGTNWQSVPPPCTGLIVGETCGSFYTALRLFEDDNDQDTKDSIEFIPDSNMVIGDEVIYYSETFSFPLTATLTEDLVVLYDSVYVAGDSVLPNFDTIYGPVWYTYNPQPQDTIMLPDTKQSLFVTQGYNGTSSAIYLTRDMMRFATNPEWWQISTGGGQSYEFSKDGNVLWIGAGGGALTRVMGLDSAYSEDAADISFRPVTGSDSIINIATDDTITTGLETVDYSAANYRYPDGSTVTYKLYTTVVVGSGGNIITDISTDPTNLDRVAYSTGYSTGTVYLSENARDASPSFSDKGGSATTGLPTYPVFGVEFIRNDNGDDILMVGTEFGAFTTEDPTGSSPIWIAQNAETGIVPVFDVRQQWRNWDDGVKNPYAVYLGTHGRGIWSTDAVLSIGDNTPVAEDEVKEVSNITVYPNPLTSEGKIAFELGSNNDVEFKVYTLQGKLVNQVKLDQLSAGAHTLNFDAATLPVGTYLITVQAGDLKEVTKFVKY